VGGGGTSIESRGRAVRWPVRIGSGLPITSSHAGSSEACGTGGPLATGVTERTLGKLENGQHVSPSTLGMVENRLGWAPGSCRRILAGGEPKIGSPDLGQAEYEDPTLWHIASTPGLPPEVVRGLVALARNWRQGDDGTTSRPDSGRSSGPVSGTGGRS
jgi:hypothetical protein